MAIDFKTLDDLIETQTRFDVNNVTMFTMT